MSRIVHSRSPCRLSLGGGGTDVSPYTEEYGGAVTNFAIDVYMEASLRVRDDATVTIHSISGGKRQTWASLEEALESAAGDHALARAVARRMYTQKTGFDLCYYAPIPERSGLGGSAALAAAMAATFNHLAHDRVDAYELAELVYKVERQDLRNLGGRQDQRGHAVAHAVVAEDAAKTGAQHAADAQLTQAPDRVLAAGAATKVGARDHKNRRCPRRLVQHKIAVRLARCVKTHVV